MVGVERWHQRADRLKPQSQKTSQSDHMDHSLVYLKETKPCHVGPSEMDGSWWRVLKDKTCSTGEGNGKSLQYSYLENPMNSMKRQKNRILKN